MIGALKLHQRAITGSERREPLSPVQSAYIDTRADTIYRSLIDLQGTQPNSKKSTIAHMGGFKLLKKQWHV